jgi:O-antigen/teichoic acid export membrane protein
MLFILSDFFINLVYGPDNDISSLVLSILSISIVSLPLGGFFTQYLIISNREKDVAKVTFKTMIFNFIYVIPLIYFYGAIGLAISVVLISFTQVYLNSRCANELFKGAFI